MRIRSVEITNFRCIRSLSLQLDDVTTLVGPNGAGKSTILRALDWFFNETILTDADVYQGAPSDDRTIQVGVTFDGLTQLDRETLGPKYAPDSVGMFTAWRTWIDGKEKFTGKAMAYLPFEEVRAADSAAGKKAALKNVAQQYPDLGIPQWTNQANALQAMDSWERDHPDLLKEAVVSDTHFFGFRGNHKLSGLFDYVLVTADLRAIEESSDSRSSVVGRILDMAIDRSGADEAIARLTSEIAERHSEINREYLSSQLADVASEISAEMHAFAADRTVRLEAGAQPLRAQATKINVSVVDDCVETPVDRQGHGLQRTLLISALKQLAKRGAQDPSGSVVVLAIEEPELFQHPTQARLFASVLRKLAAGPDSRVQVVYATHSPYFIEPRFFDQLRRVTRSRTAASVPLVTVYQASMASVSRRLEGHRALQALVGRWHQVCLKNLAEAFFANAVVLVEGDHDKAVLDGIAARSHPFEIGGIVVAVTNGKPPMPIPHAILTELGIPTLSIFDNDSGVAERMRRDGKDEGDIEQAERYAKRDNRELLRYYGCEEQAYPCGVITSQLVAMPDTLESELSTNWPGWPETCTALVKEGRGASGKNAATYALAAEECKQEPVGVLAELVRIARQLID